MKKFFLAVIICTLFSSSAYASNDKKIIFNKLNPFTFGTTLQEYFRGPYENKARNVRKAYDFVETICGTKKTSVQQCQRAANLATTLLDEFLFSVGKNDDFDALWASIETAVPPMDNTGMRKIADVYKLKKNKECADPSSDQCKQALVAFAAKLQNYGFTELNAIATEVGVKDHIDMAPIPSGQQTPPSPRPPQAQVGGSKALVSSLSARPRAGAITKK